jgi:ribonuclease Z
MLMGCDGGLPQVALEALLAMSASDAQDSAPKPKGNGVSPGEVMSNHFHKTSFRGMAMLGIVMGLVLANTPAAIAQQDSSSAGSDFKVTLLGTSTPNPLPDRFGPSTLVEAGNERLVFDCGRGSTIRLWQLRIPIGSVKLFLTHLHSDHTVGIPDLWLTGLLDLPYGNRSGPFAVWGPKGTAKMMANLAKAYEADIRIRREFTPAISSQQVSIVAHDFGEGVVYEQNRVQVTAFKVKHANVEEAFGFRIDYKGHAVAISGDMAPNENFVKYARGADLVIHEVGVARPELLQKRPSTARMIAAHHSSPEDAARDFVRIKPKLAVYTHYTRPRLDDVPAVTNEEILSRTQAVYSGPVVCGEDLMSFIIGDAVTVSAHREYEASR